MSTLPQLPNELIDHIASYLSFDELWKVRRVRFWWNEMAVRRAHSLLCKDRSTVTVRVQAIAFLPPPSAGMTVSTYCLSLAPQGTPEDGDPNLLIWTNKWEPPTTSDGSRERLDFAAGNLRLSQVHIPIPNTDFIVEYDFSRMIDTSDPLTQVESIAEKDSGLCRVRDWALVHYQEEDGTLVFCMEVPLWRYTKLYLTSSSGDLN